MTGARDLIRLARAAGVTMRLDDAGEVRLEAPGEPPADLLAALRRHRAEILDALRAADSIVPASWIAGIASLDPEAPPGDWPYRRWAAVVADCRRFLTSDFADQAGRLGWSALDLFGCDPGRPFARVDLVGLLVLLHGDRIVALTAAGAAIETATGARLVYQRRTDRTDRAPIWELPRR